MEIGKYTKNKAKSRGNLNVNQQSTLRTSHMCVCVSSCTTVIHNIYWRGAGATNLEEEHDHLASSWRRGIVSVVRSMN